METLIELTGLSAGALLAIASVTSLILGVLLCSAFRAGARDRARREYDRLAMRMESFQQIKEDRDKAFDQARDKLNESFSHLSTEALRQNSEQFMQIAGAHLKKHQSDAETDLDKRQTAIKHLLDPIQQALNKNEQQIREIEKERKQSYGNISKFLEGMQLSQAELRLETKNLVQALRRPEVRGQWGEIQLKRLVELAGMSKYCDFETQVSRRTDSGMLRPDLIVHLPDKRNIVVDAKTPLDAYLDAIQCQDESERRGHFQRHLRKVRERVDELSKKNYWSQFEHSPEVVVLFLPGEQYLAAALDLDSSLLERALSQKVILASPTSLMGILKMMAYSWRQLDLMENAEQIRSLGVELYGRIATYTEHVDKLGNALKSSVDHFNRAAGSLQTRVLPSAQRFREMGITSAKDVQAPKQIERQVKQVEQQVKE